MSQLPFSAILRGLSAGSNSASRKIASRAHRLIDLHRTALRFVVIIVSCSGAAAKAEATLYDVAFTNTVGSTTPTGSFTYDPTAQTFSNFIVNFGSQVLDFTSSANSTFSDNACFGAQTNGAGGFAVMSGTTPCRTNQVWSFFSSGSRFVNALFGSADQFTNDTSTLDVSVGMSTFGLGAPPYNDGGTFAITPASPTVHETSTLALMGAALAGLFLLRSRAKPARPPNPAASPLDGAISLPAQGRNG